MQPKERSPEKEDDNYTPPVLPGNEEKKDVRVCASIVPQTDVISMCVVPVKVKYKDSNSVYNTLSMLDNYIQGYFLKSILKKNFGIKGHKTSVSVRTLTGEKTFAVDRLKVSRKSGLNAEWINIPMGYTKDDLPVNCQGNCQARDLGVVHCRTNSTYKSKKWITDMQ